jgi:hypothetical protein
VLLVAALGLLAATLIGGARLASLRLRAVRLLVVAAAVQVGTSALAPGSGAARLAALVLTALLVGLFVVGNRHVAGTPLIGAGLLLNVLVVAANGAMPVSLSAASDAGLSRAELGLARDAMREPVDDGTWLPLLGDVVPVSLPWRPQVVSPGDVLVAAGVGLLLVASGRRQAPRREIRSTALDSESTTVGSYS